MKIGGAFEIPGTVRAVIPKGKVLTIVLHTGKDFRDQDELISVQFWGKNADAVKDIQVGENVRCTHLELGGHEYNGKFYNELKAWKCHRIGSNEPVKQPADRPLEESSDNPPESSDAAQLPLEDETLPF